MHKMITFLAAAIMLLQLTPGEAIAFGQPTVQSTTSSNMTCDQVPGWLHAKEVYTQAAASFKSGLFVEIGSYLGASACFMSHLIADGNHNNVTFHVMDTWPSVSEFAKWAPQEHLTEVSKHGGTFAKAWQYYMVQTGSDKHIHKVIQGDNMDPNVTSAYSNSSITFLYLDTSHVYQNTVAEMPIWWNKVQPGGRMCGDDFDHPGVHQPVTDFFKSQSISVQAKAFSQWCADKPLAQKASSLTQVSVQAHGLAA